MARRRSAPMARQVGRSAALADTVRTSAWPTSTPPPTSAADREQEQPVALEVGDVPRLANAVEVGGVLDVHRVPEDAPDARGEGGDRLRAAAQVDELVDDLGHVRAVLGVEAAGRDPAGVARHRLGDADHAQLLPERLGAGRGLELRRDLAEVRLPDDHRGAEVEVEAVAGVLVDDDLVGACRIGEAPRHQWAGQDGDRRRGHREQGRADRAQLPRLEDLGGDAHHERVGLRDAREARDRSSLLGAERGVVDEQRGRRDVRGGHVVRDRVGGAASAGPARGGHPDRRAGQEAEQQPGPPPRPQLRPGPDPRRAHRRRCSCTPRANHPPGARERGEATPDRGRPAPRPWPGGYGPPGERCLAVGRYPGGRPLERPGGCVLHQAAGRRRRRRGEGRGPGR